MRCFFGAPSGVTDGDLGSALEALPVGEGGDDGFESPMPKGLLDGLNEAEVLDLVAYTLAKGNKRHPSFKQR